VKVNCYVNTAVEKSRRILVPFAKGCDAQLLEFNGKVLEGVSVVWGQVADSATIIKRCQELRKPFIQVDNPYYCWGTPGIYRVTWNRMWQNYVLKRDGDRFEKFGQSLAPWAAYGDHIVLAAPGLNLCRFLNISQRDWVKQSLRRLKELTTRPIVVRTKADGEHTPLAKSLAGAHALVTLNSNAAVEAAQTGIPVFCDPGAAAAPVAQVDWALIDHPLYTDRTDWAHSLAYGQFTLAEFEDGTCWSLINREDVPKEIL